MGKCQFRIGSQTTNFRYFCELPLEDFRYEGTLNVEEILDIKCGRNFLPRTIIITIIAENLIKPDLDANQIKIKTSRIKLEQTSEVLPMLGLETEKNHQVPIREDIKFDQGYTMMLPFPDLELIVTRLRI